MARFFGSTLPGFAVLAWLARSETASGTRKVLSLP